MKHLSLLLVAAIGIGLSAAFAQAKLAKAPPPPTEWSLGDLQTLVPGTTPASFSLIDTDADGRVTQTELTQAIDSGLITLPD